jgi:hypothetical protein
LTTHLIEDVDKLEQARGKERMSFGLDSTTGQFNIVDIDAYGMYAARQFVWDTNSFSYIKMQQPILNAGSVTIPGSVTVGNFPTVQVGDARRSQTILFTSVNTTASGDTQLVAADGTKKIKVLNYVLVVAGTTNVKFRSATTDITGAMPFVANSGAASPAGTVSGWLFETAVNQALNINLSAGVQVSGHLSYFLEA